MRVVRIIRKAVRNTQSTCFAVWGVCGFREYSAQEAITLRHTQALWLVLTSSNPPCPACASPGLEQERAASFSSVLLCPPVPTTLVLIPDVLTAVVGTHACPVCVSTIHTIIELRTAAVVYLVLHTLHLIIYVDQLIFNTNNTMNVYV